MESLCLCVLFFVDLWMDEKWFFYFSQIHPEKDSSSLSNFGRKIYLGLPYQYPGMRNTDEGTKTEGNKTRSSIKKKQSR